MENNFKNYRLVCWFKLGVWSHFLFMDWANHFILFPELIKLGNYDCKFLLKPVFKIVASLGNIPRHIYKIKQVNQKNSPFSRLQKEHTVYTSCPNSFLIYICVWNVKSKQAWFGRKCLLPITLNLGPYADLIIFRLIKIYILINIHQINSNINI